MRLYKGYKIVPGLIFVPIKKEKKIILKLAANHDKVCLCISSTLSVVNFDLLSMKNPQQIKVQSVVYIRQFAILFRAVLWSMNWSQKTHKEKELLYILTGCLFYKPITIVNDDSSIVNKLETSLIDDARVIIYDCHMFIVQATVWRNSGWYWGIHIVQNLK